MESLTGIYHDSAQSFNARANDQSKNSITTTSTSTAIRSKTPSCITSANPHLSGKLMELAEEQLLMERRLNAALEETAKLRQRHLETLAPMLERTFFERTDAWVLKESFRVWYAYASQRRTESELEKLQNKTKQQTESFEADLQTLRMACQELEVEKQKEQQRADQAEVNLEMVRQEAIGYAATADRLARQLAEAEKCILKLQNESQQIAEQVRVDIANYTNMSQQLIYRGEGYSEQRAVTSPITPIGSQSFHLGAAPIDQAEASITHDSARESPTVKASTGTPTSPHSAKLVSVDPSDRASRSIDEIKHKVVNVQHKGGELSHHAFKSHASTSSFSSPGLHGIAVPFMHVPTIRPVQLTSLRAPLSPPRIATTLPHNWSNHTII